VALPGNTSGLVDHLGLLTEICDEFPAVRWHQSDHWSYEFDANWKVVVENTVESYHVATVHPKTLAFGTEEEMEHVIHENSTIMKSPIAAPAIYHRVANWLLPKLQPNCSHQYRLHHGFPNLFLIRIDAMLQVMTVEPISPDKCRLSVYVFILRATPETRGTRFLTSAWGRLKTHVIRTVLAEDARLYPDLQTGMKHSPFQGTISTREELVHAFQDFIHRKCGLPEAL
jgi:phenylpropionate dioxygenase-like ring-hydroxylating dioxygenase large terminal subunit